MKFFVQKTAFAVLLAWNALFIFSCGNSDETLKKAGLLPKARGSKGEMVLVMDSLKWKGPLGDAAREVFQESLPGMPQPEPIFSVIFVGASGFRSILKQHRNVVIITTFDSNNSESKLLQHGFTESSVQKIQTDPSLYLLKNIDEFAEGQLVLHLFSQTEEQLIQKMRENKGMIQQIFNDRETAAVSGPLLSQGLNDRMAELIEKTHGLRLKLPMGYQMAKDTTNFVWLRFPEADVDKNLFVAYKPYISEKQFSRDSVIAWRNALCKEHFFSDKEKNPESYMMTEDRLPLLMDTFSLRGQYAQRLHGLWIIKTPLFGGPFISYTFTSQETGLIYYAEGFVSAPGINKREHIRELKILLEAMQVFPKK